jgi:hypothetical protein
MALELRDATQVCSFEPPLPMRAYAISTLDSSAQGDLFPGSQTDGKRYGKITINSSVWTRSSGQAIAPMVVGERFRIYHASSGSFPTSIGVYATASTETIASPDLLQVWELVTTGQITAADTNGPYTVQAVVNTSGRDGWTIYFSASVSPGITVDGSYGIVTLPEPRNGVWFGQLGYVQSLNYSYSSPGGPTDLTFVLDKPPTYRHPAMDPGRVIQAFRGGSCIWDGIQTEPSPSATGWTISANGSGTFGSVYSALYTAWNADNPIDLAIGRGLRWGNDNKIGSPTGIYLGQEQDSGSMVISDFLNLLCTGGGLYWSVEPPASSHVPAPPWNIRLRPFPTDLTGDPLAANASTSTSWNVQEWQRTDLKAKLPRVPADLYIVNTNPIPRSVTNDYNTLVIKYMATADKVATSTVKASAATYKVVVVDNPASVAAHGRNEYYLDISTSSVMTEASVVTLGHNILSHYVRANFSQDFIVQPGQLLNNGGYPVDLAVNWCGKVATIQGDNAAFGGEVSYGAVTFFIGNYTFDDDSQTATVSPFQTDKTDISNIISDLYPGKFA